ncbi:MAG: questin oxidase family protein [Burkholderiaceae bacterium]
MSILEVLLDDGVHTHAEYRGGLANHLPMALVALHGLGAPDSRLQSFASAYGAKLEPAPPAVDWPPGEPWKDRFGDPAAWPAYRALFAQWLVHEGRDAVLPQVLPALMPGCGAAAFHGLIRTAYAVASGHTGELADGLAYWACRFLPLPEAGEHGREDDPGAVIDALRTAMAPWQSDAGLIVDRMQAAAGHPAFAQHTARLRVGDATLAALARLALERFADGGDFTVLHLATASHALRLLLPFIDEPLPALRSFWVAAAAAAASVRERPPLPPLATLPDWPEIVERAIASDDEHVVKLVHTCREQHAAYGWDACRRAAARAVQPG